MSNIIILSPTFVGFFVSGWISYFSNEIITFSFFLWFSTSKTVPVKSGESESLMISWISIPSFYSSSLTFFGIKLFTIFTTARGIETVVNGFIFPCLYFLIHSFFIYISNYITYYNHRFSVDVIIIHPS